MKTPFTLTYWLSSRQKHNFWCHLGVAFLIYISLPALTFAQNKIWDKTIGGNKEDRLQITQQTQDGGYILGGTSNSDKSGDKSEGSYKDENGYNLNDYWVVKTNAAGVKVWDKTFGGKKDEFLSSIAQTQDGGYILGGYSYSGIGGDKSQANKGEYDYWVLKLDASGNKVWDKTFGGSRNDVLSALQQTSDGGYILGGFSTSGIGGDKSEPSRDTKSQTLFWGDYWVVKLNANGNKVWDKTLGGNKEDFLRSIAQTQDGGYLLGGSSASGMGGDKSQANKGQCDVYNCPRDYWIVKLNANGGKVWDKTYGGDQEDLLTAMQPTQDGGYILGGTSASNVSGDKSEPSRVDAQYQYYRDDYWVLKLRADGTKVWDKTVGGNSTESLGSVQEIKGGGYILGGSSNSGIGSDKTEASRGGSDDYWIVKLNAKGQKVWDKTLGGNYSDNLTSVAQTSDGNFILGGYSNSQKGQDKSEANKMVADNMDSYPTSDYWVVKTDNSNTNLSQYISIGPVPTKRVGDAPFTLSANASSGLPVTLSVVSGPLTVKDNVFTITGEGKATIKATQAGNANYKPAPDSIISFDIYGKSVANIQWDKTFGSLQRETLSTIIPTPDGGYLLGGSSRSDKGGDKSEGNRDTFSKNTYDYWIVKTDAAGKKIWDKTFGGRENDNLTALVATPDGGYLLGGSSFSDKGGDKSENNLGMRDAPSQFTPDYWVVKIDAAGNKVWDQTYGGNKADELATMVATTDGGFILGGSSTSAAGADKSQDNKGVPDINNYLTYDYWVLKIDATGNKVWDKTIGGRNHDNLAALFITTNGDLLLGGTSGSGISGDKSQEKRGQVDYWVVRLTANGTKVWDKTYGGTLDTAINIWCEEGDCRYYFGGSNLATIAATPDGGFLLGGSSNAEKGFEKSEGNPSTDEYGSDDYLRDYWVVKIDGSGNKIWDQTYGGNSTSLGSFGVDGAYYSGYSELKSIIPAPDGGYILGGFSNSQKGRDKSESYRREYGKEIFNEGVNSTEGIEFEKILADYWVLKIDEFGAKKWDQTIGGNGNDVLSAVLPVGENGYLLAGSSTSEMGADKTEVNKGGLDAFSLKTSDYWVVKIQGETTPATATWNMRYGGAGTDNFTDAIKTTDGGYLSAGYTNSGVSGDKTQSSQGQNDYWIVKSDKNGKKVWEKRFGGSGEDYLNRVIQTQDGGYLLAGSSLSGKSGDKSQASQGDRDYWVVKTDKQGNKQWDKSFGGLAADELKKVVQLASGEYVLGGYSNSGVSGDKTQPNQGGKDYWLVKISSTGNKLWDKRYGGNGDDVLGSFTTTDNGGFLLSGTSLSGANGDKSQASRGNRDYWVVKVDASGIKQWDKTFGGSGADEAFSVARSGSDYLIAGTSSSGKSNSKSQASKGGQDYWVVKVTSSGTQVWDRTFGGDKDDELRASTFSPEGYYVLGGSSASGASGNKTQSSQGSSDYWVVAVDQEGNKVYDQRYGGGGSEELRTVTSAQDGGLLLGGRSNSGVSGDRSQPSQGGTDYWLIRITPASATTVAARVATQPETGNQQPEVKLQAYPNPMSEKATIRFRLPETQQATVKVYDNQGREVTTLFNGQAKANQPYEVEWKANNQAAGLYFLQLQTATQKQQQKLLLTK